MSCSANFRIVKLSGLTVLALFVAASGWARSASQSQQPSQGGSSGQSTPPSQPPPSGQLPGAGPSGQLPGSSAPAAAPQTSPEEDKDYKAFYDARTGDPQKQAQMGEDFVKKYPNSKYTGVVYAALASNYLTLGDEDKMFASAQKSIDFDPDNIDALSIMTWAGARRTNPNSPDAADRFAKLENYGHHAITLLAALQKPANVDDATFNAQRNDELSMCHSGLGFMDFVRQRYPDAITELTQAVQLANNPDQVDYYILGAADERSSHFDDAIAAFGKCAEKEGGVQDRCKTAIDDTKKRALEQPAPAPTPAPAPSH
jgi:tetratricopeptide (TPR) repeat protein